jgi:hypothetical protein
VTVAPGKRRAPAAAGGEAGEGMVAALLLLAGALLPLLFLLALEARVEQAELAAEQAASSAVRAAVLAPTAASALQDADAELAAAQAATAAPLALELSGSFTRGGVLEADVSAAVPVGSLPFLGALGTVAVAATARAPVDPYRSFTEGT